MYLKKKNSLGPVRYEDPSYWEGPDHRIMVMGGVFWGSVMVCFL